jgi:hypothetical protein
LRQETGTRCKASSFSAGTKISRFSLEILPGYRYPLARFDAFTPLRSQVCRPAGNAGVKDHPTKPFRVTILVRQNCVLATMSAETRQNLALSFGWPLRDSNIQEAIK